MTGDARLLGCKQAAWLCFYRDKIKVLLTTYDSEIGSFMAN